MKTIAVIDDDIYIGNMLEEVLRNNGYHVTRAYSGTEALLLLSQNSPDLVLLDLMLPGLSGEEILPKIQNIPVIVVSAKVDVQDKINLLLGGAADYMTKPFNTEELLARIACSQRRYLWLRGQKRCWQNNLDSLDLRFAGADVWQFYTVRNQEYGQRYCKISPTYGGCGGNTLHLFRYDRRG